MKPVMKLVKGWYFCEYKNVIGCGSNMEVAYKDFMAKFKKVYGEIK